jgi:hypothetical protein
MSQYCDTSVLFLTFATIPVNYVEWQRMHMIHVCTLVTTAFKVDIIISYSTIPAGTYFLSASPFAFITLSKISSLSILMTPMILTHSLPYPVRGWSPTVLAGCCPSTSNQSASHQENLQLPAADHRRCVFLAFLYPATYRLHEYPWLMTNNSVSVDMRYRVQSKYEWDQHSTYIRGETAALSMWHLTLRTATLKIKSVYPNLF